MSKKATFKTAEQFYEVAIRHLQASNTPFLIGGTYSFSLYTGIQRETKDLDIFCKASQHLKLLKILEQLGCKIEISDDRWLAKAYKNSFYIDIIFGTPSGIWVVDDSWFKQAPAHKLFNTTVKIIPVEEMIWCRAYVQDRTRYDGADINHIILKLGKNIDWKRLMSRMEAHWELLFAQLLNFRFVYPANRDIFPKWVIEELISRVNHQLQNPTPKDLVCRGPLLSRTQYEIDIQKWGYKTII